jgi:hypothetical protein
MTPQLPHYLLRCAWKALCRVLGIINLPDDTTAASSLPVELCLESDDPRFGYHQPS